MLADGWKVVIREVENTLLFSNVVTFPCSINVDKWVLESYRKCIIPTSAKKVKQFSYFLEYIQVS